MWACAVKEFSSASTDMEAILPAARKTARAAARSRDLNGQASSSLQAGRAAQLAQGSE
jgi:hypothetical protein